MVLNPEIARLSGMVEERCLTWLKRPEGGDYVLIDPTDKAPVKSHYAASHLSAGLILSGIRRKNKEMLNAGLSLLRIVVAGWDEDHRLADYHHDFNNFAFCVVIEALSSLGGHEDIINSIKNIVLADDDSDHVTVNWLPMRVYVNKSRFEWTQDYSYNKISEGLFEKINHAIYKDGFIDDR